MVLAVRQGEEHRHQAVQHQRTREQPVHCGGKYEHPAEGVDREALRRSEGRMGQFIGHHSRWFIDPSHSQEGLCFLLKYVC